ncbi:PKD domain containing protein [Nocardioides abyssi]|uniref:PKD domain containing protein n=1 Tax=Nocardioides abyssi TaxID=3058370 RepID=A0ABT8EU61_9ACTN|nr:PKD domain containing protein [Nocardioides abyssi]MDN4161710.1 PKD domain containing protein [Nocardioides abyssi]
MRARPGVLVATVAACLVTTVLGVPAASADGLGDRTVAEQPATGTPQVLDGRVYAVVQVGGTIVLGGTFSRVRDAGTGPVLRRRGLLAFDATTGRIDRSFDARVVGEVRALEAAADGRSVYVGGTFTRVAGKPRARLARVRVADGSVVGSFRPGRVAGKVRDLALRDGRLWVGGAFTHIGGRRQVALATLAPATGRATSYMSLRVRGNHRRGVTQVLKLDLTPDGSRLVAVGNFARLGDRRSHQLLVLRLGGSRARPAGFRTRFFEAPCSRAYDSYLRDVDVSPDGRFFVVTTTGAYGGPDGPCDSASRFETRAQGSRVQPSWVDRTGGDTSYAVEVTATAVYVGGHQRWWNNPFAGNRPGPGAVRREGIAALDPLNGLPLSWNPGRTRGVGVFDFLATDQGLWVVSDTTWIGGLRRARVALLPAAEPAVPSSRTTTVPTEVYVAAPAGLDRLVRRSLTATAAGAPSDVATDPAGAQDWRAVRGAFMVDGWLHVAHRDGTFTRRTFDGTTLGPERAVAAQDRLRPLTSWRADVRAATSMAYQDGRLYFTRAGAAALYYRYFSPESGVVGAQRRVASRGVPGFRPGRLRGLVLTRDHAYVVGADGVLRRTGWRSGPISSAPVGGTARRVSGSGDGWLGRAVFAFQGPDGAPLPAAPTAPTGPTEPTEPTGAADTGTGATRAPVAAASTIDRAGSSDPDLLLGFDEATGAMGSVIGSVENAGSLPVEVSVATGNGGRVRRDVGTLATGARFPAVDARTGPAAAVVVRPAMEAADDGLSPGGGRFTFGADFAIDAESEGTSTDNGDNVVQRGLYQDDAQYKLQVDHRRVSCRVAGDRGHVVVVATTRVRPGTWYRATCSRRLRVVTLTLARVRADELTWARSRSRPRRWTGTGRIGRVVFDRSVPLAVGAKVLPEGAVAVSDSDQLNGVVDNVHLDRPGR